MRRLAYVGLAALGAAYVAGGGGQLPVRNAPFFPPLDASATSAAPAPLPRAPAPALTLGRPTNAVILLIDDLPVADSAFMPDSSIRHYTPTIDRLASRSLVLDNFYTVTPICTPSRYSLLTGNYPSRATSAAFLKRFTTEGATVPEFNTLITSVETTLPKRLQALGVRTGFTGKDHVAETAGYSPPMQGARLTDPGVQAQLAQNQQFVMQGMRDIGFDEAYSIYRTNPSEQPVVETRVHNLDWIVGGALKFIDGNADRKFFLVVSLTIPHGPLDPASSWNADPRMTPWGYLAQAPNVMPARSTLTARVKAAGRAGDENYLWLDDAVEAVVDSLNSHGLLDKTAIFFLSDHGMAGKGSIYRSASHTAGFVRYLGRSGHVESMIENIDVQPTILQMFGAPPAGDGVSMLPILEGTSNQVRDRVYLELGYARSVLTDSWQYVAVRHTNVIRQQAALKSFPLAHWPNYDGLHPLERDAIPLFPNYLATDQLYDVRSDPKEQMNLYGQAATGSISTQLRALLRAEAAKTPGSFPIN